MHCYSVGVVHALLISLICWGKHKLVYTLVSILWLLMLVWGVLLHLVTVSCGPVFLSWVVSDSVLLKSLSGVWLWPSWVFSCCPSCQLWGVSQSKWKFHFEFVQYLGTEFVWVSQCHCQSISEIRQSLTVSWVFSWSPSYSYHFRVVGWC